MPPLVFRYTYHANFLLFERNITKQSVEYTVNSPDRTYQDKVDPTLTVAERVTSPGMVMKVWYKLVDGAPSVHTALIVSLRRESTKPKPKKRRK